MHPDARSAKLSAWLPYWLEQHIAPRRKLSTYDKYEAHIRLYLFPLLFPLLGTKRLESLSVADVRRFLTRIQARIRPRPRRRHTECCGPPSRRLYERNWSRGTWHRWWSRHG